MDLNIGLFNESFPPTIDGVANAVLNYAKNINKHFGRVVVATPKYPNVADNYDFEVFRYPSISIFGPNAYRAGNPFSPTSINYLRNKKFDIMHVHSPFASSVLTSAINAAQIRHTPTILTYHTKFDYDIDRYIKNPLFNSEAKKFVLNNINHADEVWVVSKGAGDDLRSTGFEGEYRVMYNGTDYEKGRVDSSEIDRVYRLSPDEKVFLFVGRMLWYKNIKLILDALKILKQKNIKFKTFFVGEGNDRPSIMQYSELAGLKNDVIFTGAIYDRNKVKEFYSRADLLLFPSTYDTSGLVVKEAASAFCPSLLMKGSCAAESIIDCETGLLIKDDPVNFAKKIEDSIKNPDFLKKLGENAAEKVYLSWYDSVKTAYSRYEEIYCESTHKKRTKKIF